MEFFPIQNGQLIVNTIRFQNDLSIKVMILSTVILEFQSDIDIFTGKFGNKWMTNRGRMT